MCTGPARHQPRTSAEVQRENERDVGIAEAVAGEIGRYVKSGVGRRHELVEHYATPGHKFGKLRHWRPFAGPSAVPERGQGVAKDIFHCCVAFAFAAARKRTPSELQSLLRISYALICLQKKNEYS